MKILLQLNQIPNLQKLISIHFADHENVSSPILKKIKSKNPNNFWTLKGTDLQIEKAPINDRLLVSKLS